MFFLKFDAYYEYHNKNLLADNNDVKFYRSKKMNYAVDKI